MLKSCLILLLAICTSCNFLSNLDCPEIQSFTEQAMHKNPLTDMKVKDLPKNQIQQVKKK